MNNLEDYNTNKLLKLFISVLEQAQCGTIYLLYKRKVIFSSQGQYEGPLAKIYINDLNCLKNFFVRGDLGWAESYIEKLWTTDHLSDFLQWGAMNFKYFSKYIRGKWYIILYLRLKHYLNSNTKNGSKKNITYHYDLGNDFYESWLDKSMTYSSAIFQNENQRLYQAQINKFKKLASLCRVKENDKVLEIGCGWGAYSIFLAKTRMVNVDAITISKKQYEVVKKKIFEEGLNQKINVKLLDYRDIKGKYDKIFSIEMFEAVGEKYWTIYFDKIKSHLKENGRFGLQTITIDNNFFQSYRKFPDFIQTYIFPGGMLASQEALTTTLGKNGLKIYKKYLFGDHYARTLNYWKNSFEQSWDEIKKFGFDSNFKRLWEYYFSYCEGGFKSGNINVGQFLIGRE